MNNKFPRLLYIKIDDGEEGKEFFLAHQDIETAAELGEKTIVAIYKLQEIVQVETEITTKKL